MSIRGTGLCLLDDDSINPVSHTDRISLDSSKMVGSEIAVEIVTRILEVVDKYKPNLIAMEDYAIGTQNTNNLTRLAEIGGAIKFACVSAGYTMGYGVARNKVERKVYMQNTTDSNKLFVLQASTAMKKFCLAKGNIDKENQGAYLAEVHHRLGQSFTNTDEADAYMHAWMAGIMVAVLRDEAEVDGLPVYQQESLLSHFAKLPKGMSMNKALRLSNREKMDLILPNL